MGGNAVTLTLNLTRPGVCGKRYHRRRRRGKVVRSNALTHRGTTKGKEVFLVSALLGENVRGIEDARDVNQLDLAGFDGITDEDGLNINVAHVLGDGLRFSPFYHLDCR